MERPLKWPDYKMIREDLNNPGSGSEIRVIVLRNNRKQELTAKTA